MIDIQLDSGLSVYSEHDIEPPGDPDDLDTWVHSIISKHQKKADKISYFLVNDEELLAMNRQYLDHDTLTDILTFAKSHTIV